MTWPTSNSNAALLLDKRIQLWLHRQKWASLKPAQSAAVPIILQGTRDAVICAPTAAGKTEAAFLPILTYVLQEDLPSVRVLYISPLKALINDQFQRMELLCEDLHVPVFRWHGDVSQSHKNKLKKNPAGVLLITPESLEALMMRQGQSVREIFAHLSFVVIDEVHSFMGNERGVQLQSLLHRLEHEIGHRVTRIGLSATLASPSEAGRFLRGSDPTAVSIINPPDESGGLKASLFGYLKKAPPPDKEPSDNDVGADTALVRDLYQRMRGTHNLVFCNSKREVEDLTDKLVREAEQQGTPNEFYAHHGNLSKEIREDVEERLRSSERPITCFCTSTLEMGIDIGDMRSVAQIGAPPSVASLRQRVGRSGRRQPPPVLRMYITDNELDAHSDIQMQLRLELFQGTAMLELMTEQWLEPPASDKLHLSTLAHQVMALIVQRGGATPALLHRVLVSSGPFKLVGQDRFVALLRAMKEKDLVTQMPDGVLLLGEKGERIAEHYSFFAVFNTPEEYRVIAEGKTLGTLPVAIPIKPGDPLIFAGKRWVVVDLDDDKKVILVKRSHTRKAPRFHGDSADVDLMVRQRMRSLYLREDIPPFLDATARKMLAEGRSAFRLAGLDTKDILEVGRSTLIFPWAGDKETTTLRLVMVNKGLTCEQEQGVLEVQAGLEYVQRILNEITLQPSPEPYELALGVLNKQKEKYDWCLGFDLLSQDFAIRALDVEKAKETASQLHTGNNALDWA